jgi:suppressor of G2 allele of SKP1
VGCIVNLIFTYSLDHLKEERKKAMDEVDATQAEDATPAKEEDIQPTVDKGKGKAPAPSSYPTSSRSGPKNWDKLDGVDSDEEESNVNVFFKKLYKNATPEQQRAMMKSFTESNGTSLSTDWNDVGSRTVETVPPEGVEAKKWDK